MIFQRKVFNFCPNVSRLASNKTHYEVLGVKRSASQGDIRTAFIELSKKYHPDKQSGDIEHFKKINEAYAILSRESTRSEYDCTLIDGSRPKYSYSNSYSSTEQMNYDASRRYAYEFNRFRTRPPKTVLRVKLLIAAIVCSGLITYGLSLVSFARLRRMGVQMTEQDMLAFSIPFMRNRGLRMYDRPPKEE